jgi:predicted alpha-1,6-mannanase (GH76 family)
MDQRWANWASSCEAAVTQRHLKPLPGLPGTQLGVVAWPSTRRDRLFGTWHYWWQAHLLDCLLDAQLRDPRPHRLTEIKRQVRSQRLRNFLAWTNNYYDDMAWLALALARAARIADVQKPGALSKLANQLLEAWAPQDGGGIPWRKGEKFFNVPANGPAGIFLARYGDHLKRAGQMADWIDDKLIDPQTHLVFDGIQDDSLVRPQYTYCQGVVLGLETELAARTGAEVRARHAARVHRLVAAVSEHMAPSGVLKGSGGGDGGLFAGITARYLALLATNLPGDTADDVVARDTARQIVLASAKSAWDHRQTVDGLPVFGPFWDRHAQRPTTTGAKAEFVEGAVMGSEIAERDLSVQLSGWMLMEAACNVTAVSET